MTALLALAEREGFSGRHLIDAFIVAVEVACRVGRYVAPHYTTGWHATATVGAIGAAAGAAQAVGLDADGIARNGIGRQPGRGTQVDVRHDV